MADRWFWRGVAASAVAGFVIRVVNALSLPATKLITDATYYHVQANLIAKGHGFDDPYYWLTTGQLRAAAVHPPLFPLILSITSKFGGTTLTAHRITAGVVGIVIIVAIALLARELAGGAAGIVAAAVAAIYPNFWGLEGSLMSESLAVALVTLSLFVVIRWAKEPTTRGAVLVALLIALASLTRPETILFLPLVILPIIATRSSLDVRRKVALGAVVLVSVGVVLAPWLIRNLTGFSRPVFFSTNGDEVIGVANCRPTYYDPRFLGYWSFLCNGNLNVSDDAKRSALDRTRGFDFMKSNSDRFLGTVVWARLGRVADVYHPFENARYSADEGRRLKVADAGLWVYWACLPFAFVGCRALWKRNREGALALLSPFVVVFVTAIYAYGAVRFRAIAEPSLVVFAAIGITVAAQRLRRSTPTTEPA